MTRRFNLLDESWLPVRLADGRVRDVSLLELFERAGEIQALAETAPPSLIAEYRLLLAITHRALTWAHGPWRDKDRARWYREGLPQEALCDYLEHWRERFWLFHPEQPFLQVAALASLEETRDRQKPWTQISLASANGNAPVVFDHSCDVTPTSIAPALALRSLLGFLQFTPGGLVKTLRDSDKAGPLANTAAALPVGANLQQTLCLALHPASIREDLPSWERTPAQRRDLLAEPSLATGANDRYTRLSRAVLLLETEAGQVQWLRFAAGIALGDDPNAPDPMASYRAGSNSLVRLSFTEGRALWRDLPALLPDAEGKASQPATVLGWAANLHVYLGAFQREQPLLIAGLASDQAKLLRWRCEQIALPTVMLAETQLAGYLRSEMRRAEALHEQIRTLATSMLADTMSDPRNKDTRARARAVLDAGASAASFFATAEHALPTLLQRIGAGDGAGASRHWSACLLQAAEVCWEILRRNLGQSPLALRAEARAWPRFRGLLRDLQPAVSNPKNTKEAQA
ncbi:type I-E CRISPR-associated protein Cse1/CasA [Azotobacter armeniacus]